MKKTHLEEYSEFFLELPPTDYLNDIEIQDEYEKTADGSAGGLSDEQVSALARDSLTDARRLKRSSQPSSGDTPASPPE